MNTTQQMGRRTAVIALAVVGAVVVRALARAADVDLLVKSDPGTRAVGLASVVIVALLAGLGALGVVTLIGRSVRRPRPRRMWLAISLPLLILSLVGPLGAATAGAGLALASMHVVVGVILIVGMSSSLPARRIADDLNVAPEPERHVR